MAVAFIGLGSNLGNREANLNAALDQISRLPKTKVICRSSWIETDPVGVPPQDKFLNGVAKIEAHWKEFDFYSEAEKMLGHLQKIEEQLGRPLDHSSLEPRVIDLDLLDYGGIGMKTARLELPHPRMHERRFVLEPLAEIEPEWFHPVLAETAEMLLKKLK